MNTPSLTDDPVDSEEVDDESSGSAVGAIVGTLGVLLLLAALAVVLIARKRRQKNDTVRAVDVYNSANSSHEYSAADLRSADTASDKVVEFNDRNAYTNEFLQPDALNRQNYDTVAVEPPSQSVRSSNNPGAHYGDLEKLNKDHVKVVRTKSIKSKKKDKEKKQTEQYQVGNIVVD